MPIVNAADFGDSFEDKLAREGEYDVRIAKAELKDTKKADRKMIACMLVIEGADGDGVQPFNETLILPKAGEEKGTKRMFMQRIVRFTKTFDIDLPLDVDDSTGAVSVPDDVQVPSLFAGQTARVMVTTEEDDQGTMRNRLKLPRA